MEERELLVSSPRKSVETQAHLSASNIDREASPSFTLSLFVAFLPLSVSTRFVPPPYRFYVQEKFKKQTSCERQRIIFHVYRAVIKSNAQNISLNLYL